MVVKIIPQLENNDNKSFILNLYQDYYDLVRKTVYNITYDANNLEDLVNDTFLNLLKKFL